jgi:hypothetical protein
MLYQLSYASLLAYRIIPVDRLALCLEPKRGFSRPSLKPWGFLFGLLVVLRPQMRFELLCVLHHSAFADYVIAIEHGARPVPVAFIAPLSGALGARMLPKTQFPPFSLKISDCFREPAMDSNWTHPAE